MMKTLNEQIFHVWQVADTDFENDVSSSNCLSCYGTRTIEPLDWTSFDILKEWTMGVPVIGQIILESYINKESLSKSENICTLPITIKGIPKDAKDIENWHDIICDGSNTCKYKEDLELQKKDFENEVLCLNAEEKRVLTRISQIVYLGIPNFMD
ncbi:unnamed protein product [Mytilus coruscus]|uniref:Uncharacterized protein n=1 Tax=Mytilus coruscus TaxID=42192 RepID=A0A6J8E6L8_MYTCO|nr:unnamed protein product [Mytilus coruscus]